MEESVYDLYIDNVLVARGAPVEVREQRVYSPATWTAPATVYHVTYRDDAGQMQMIEGRGIAFLRGTPAGPITMVRLLTSPKQR